jgi:hypothetical protein
MSAGGDLGYVGQWKRPAGLLTRADVEVKRFEIPRFLRARSVPGLRARNFVVLTTGEDG